MTDATVLDASLAEDEARHIFFPRRTRAWFYTIALAVVATLTIFTNLGGPRMEGDEAHYALCTDSIRHTGQWLTLRPHPPGPYLNKPPLYMWLTAATYDLVPGFAEKYRFWSAVFGVGSVALTCLLGCLLFTPEVGALAGALLLTNRQFLLEHGARAGDMDSGLTLLMAGSLVLAWLILRGGTAWWGWVGIGMMAGLASLLKPFFGFSILATTFVLLISLGRGVSWRSRIEGMLLAVILSVIVAGPWYAIQWHRFGQTFVDAIVKRQVVERFTAGLNAAETRGPAFYLWGEPGDRELSITFSSPAFIVAIPAPLFAAVAAWRGRGNRRAFALVAMTGICWVAALSASRGKFLHYAYPIFPVICVAIAATSRELIGLAATRMRDEASRARLQFAATAVIALICVVAFCRLGFHVMPEQRKAFVPWETYNAFRPAIEAGTMRFVLYGLPTSAAEWDEVEPALNSTEMFYLWHMGHAVRVKTPEDLALILQLRQPTLAFLSKRRPLRDVYERSRLAERIEERFTFDHRSFTAVALDLDGILHPQLSPGAANPYLELTGVDPPRVPPSRADGQASEPAGWPFTGSFTVRVRPPLAAEVRVNAMVRRSGETRSRQVKLTLAGARPASSGPLPLAFDDGQRLTATLDRDRKDTMAPREVIFKLESADEAETGEPIRGTITDVWLDVQLRSPSEESSRR